MKINNLLVKPKWKRRLPSNQEKQLTQDDFLNELFPTAHPINNPQYKAMRPIWEYDEKKQDMVISGWDEVERVTYGLEQIVMRAMPVHMFGNGVWFGDEGENNQEDFFRIYKSHWNVTGMNDALLNWFHDAGATGDSALYTYVDSSTKSIRYKVFSILNDDKIYKPNKNTFVREFIVNNTTIIEVYDDKSINTWIQESILKEKEDVLSQLKASLELNDLKVLIKSEDNWVCIDSHSHGLGFCPVAYLRFRDVFYGAGVDIRERMERLLSYWGDSNNAFGMPILVLNSAPMSLPPMGVGNKTMAFKNTDGEAKLLTPPDASTSFTLDLKENKKNYCNVVGVVIIDQETLKGGDYSGAYLNNLYYPVVQWCTSKRSEIRHNINEVIRIFTAYVGAIEEDSIGFSNLKMSWTIEPHTPKNKMEEASILSMSVGAKFTSRKTASGEADWNSPFEDKLLKEQDTYDDNRTIKVKEVESKTEEEIVVEPEIDNKLK